MFVVTVIPIKKGISKETLSYLSSFECSPGSIIEIPLRSKTERGLVLLCEKAENQKAEIKDMPFALRKIESGKEKRLLRTSLLASLKHISEYFVSPLGSFLAQAVRPDILLEEDFLSKQKEIEPMVFESYAVQQRDNERFDIYKSLIRESFAKQKSVFFTAPTEERAKQSFEMLSRGIEEYSLLELFNSKKKLKETLKKISDDSHPLLLVGTPDLLPLIPSNTGTMIVDEEHSRFYRKRQRPFLDTRSLLLAFAKESKIKIFFGALLLRTETHNQVFEGEIMEYGHIANKINHPVKTLVVDLKKSESSEQSEKKAFKVFSNELSEMIAYAHSKNKCMFVLGLRRGLSPQTICLDCGNTVLCEKCEAPVVLHKTMKEEKATYTFICHHCGDKRDAMEKCKHCDSWRLEAFGIGTQRIAEEIEHITGDAPFILDSDTAKTGAQARKISESFLKKGGVLVGTEMAFDYLGEESVEYAAVASFDALFSIPDFRANEHILRILLETKLLTSENLLVQGRNITDPIVETSLNADLGKFIKEELAARKQFQYPPFSTFIKLSIKARKDVVKKDIEIITKLLEKWNPTVFPAFIKSEKGKTIAHMLLTLPKIGWPNEELRNILLSLPPYIEIKVDPESLL
ncbi:MAG TPA: hypothetical protein VEC13_00310 [Candidatus Paceibacterota bacterium]|nr:hypothetical protein [Candidatus Paceibacterota bacterium]